MPKRKIVSPSELNAWLTAEIQKIDGCHDCKLIWTYRLRDPELNGGCNWSEVNLRLGSDTDLKVAAKAAAAIEARAFELFNLEEEPPLPPRAAPEFRMEMERRRLYLPVLHLDANLVNAKQKSEAVNQLETWRDTGVIELAMSGVAHGEAQAGEGANAEARKRKAALHLYTINKDGDAKEDNTYASVEAILWGKAADANQANDVEVVCEAIKWHAILVTNDGGSKLQPGGILGNRGKLQELGGIQILRPEEAVAFARGKINERDDFNRKVAELTGKAMPDWTDKD